jgi:hypothetical protein
MAIDGIFDDLPSFGQEGVVRWPIKQVDPWHRWFAWHPVRVGDEWVWLETIERQIICPELGGASEYRFPLPRIERA